MEIGFLSDKVLINFRYRSELMSALSNKGLTVSTFGLFSFTFVSFLFRLHFKKSFIGFSSNILSNMVFLSFFYTKGFVLFNGLGRHDSRFFRFVIILLIKLNKNKLFFFQNLAFYRFVLLHSNNDRKSNFYYVPGSGATVGLTPCNSAYLLPGSISRDSKLSTVFSDLLLTSNLLSSKITLVGVTKPVDSSIFNSIGFVKHELAYSFFNIFIHPDGYSEGFPHSLANSISLNYPCIVTKKFFVLNKLYLFNPEVYFFERFVLFIPNSQMIEFYSIKNVVSLQLNAIVRYVHDL